MLRKCYPLAIASIALGSSACAVVAEPSGVARAELRTPCVPTDAGAADEAHRAPVEALVQPILDGQWVSGMIVGLISERGREVYAWGSSDDRGGAPNADTIWEIGSVTKTFDALLLAQRVLAGRVTLEQPVQALLPADRVQMPTRSGKQVTLLQLASHTSGLPRLPDNLSAQPSYDPRDPYARYSEALLFDFLDGYALTRDPGESFEYSNLGAGLLGHALALEANERWENQIATAISRPLELEDTTVELTSEQSARFAQPHDAEQRPVPAWTFDVLASAGALRSSLTEMLRYAALQAGLEDAGPLRDAIALCQVPRADLPGPNPEHIGLGWLIHDERFVWHNGGTGGFGAFVGADPVGRTGVVVLTNTESGGYQPETQLGHALQAVMAEQAPTAVALPPAPISLPTATLDRYTGEFVLGSGTSALAVSVVRDGDHLRVRLADVDARLYAATPLTFYARTLAATGTFQPGATPELDAWAIDDGSGAQLATRR